MRHSTIELTMRHYVSLSIEGLDTGLSVLPGIEDQPKSKEAATS